jgi:hypothetical protein
MEVVSLVKSVLCFHIAFANNGCLGRHSSLVFLQAVNHGYECQAFVSVTFRLMLDVIRHNHTDVMRKDLFHIYTFRKFQRYMTTTNKQTNTHTRTHAHARNSKPKEPSR